jgi:hypothetical protein
VLVDLSVGLLIMLDEITYLLKLSVHFSERLYPDLSFTGDQIPAALDVYSIDASKVLGRHELLYIGIRSEYLSLLLAAHVH